MTSDFSLQEEINICIQSGITPTELLIIKLILLAIDGEPNSLINYISNISNGKIVLRQVLESLMNKGIINSTFNIPNEGESLNVKKIPFNKNFIKRYFKEANIAGKEFFDAYPPFINIGGKLCSIKNFTKANLFSLEDFCRFYTKSIKYSKVKHEFVMEMLEYGKTHNLVNYSIIEFIASQKYNEIDYIKNSGNVNGYNNTELL
jgi:hypothetical protein